VNDYFAGFLKNVKLKGFIDPEKHRIKKTSIPAMNCRYDGMMQRSFTKYRQQIGDILE
jgi:hypothetical protein